MCNVKCKLGDPEFTQQGRGKSKRIAKRQAALKLLVQIKDDPELAKRLEEKTKNGVHGHDDSLNGENRLGNGKEKFHKKFTGFNLFTALKTSAKPTMSKLAMCSSEYLHELSIENRVFEVLTQLSTEEDFKFEIFAIPSQEDSGFFKQTKMIKNLGIFKKF